MLRRPSQWFFLALWIAGLAWALFRMFNAENPALDTEVNNRLMDSLFVFTAPKVDWSLLAFFNAMGLWSFTIFFLLLAQPHPRGFFVTKLIFFAVSMVAGSFAFLPYLITQSQKAPPKPLAKGIKDFAHSPLPAVVLLLLLGVLVTMTLWKGHLFILGGLIQDVTFVQVMATDFVLYWIISVVLVWQDGVARTGRPSRLSALALVPLAGALAYLLTVNLRPPKITA